MIRAPLCTYRLQLRPGFGFDEAAALAPYLARLGASHLYASPYLQATPGSTHGYDVVNHHQVNAELGGRDGHDRMCRALGEVGLGQVLDLVPNHMAISGPENAWWWDVLENGPSSRYASYFDVDWEPENARAANKVLLPILGDHYGRVLEAGELRIARQGGAFHVRYYEHTLPVAPRSLDHLLGRAAEATASDELAFIADALRDLPLPTATDRKSAERRHRDKEVLKRQLIRLLDDEAVLAAVDAEVDRLNSDHDRLGALLDEQNYRLAFWRTAGRELGYRRFFDINDLVGLRVEDPEVFEDTHRLPLAWLKDGVLDGVRIDHPDGLRDPEQYFRRLREAAPAAWIVAEKILQPNEALPSSWAVQGTTGYGFLNLVQGLFVDPAAEAAFTELYAELTGEPTDFEVIVREGKLAVMRELFGSDLNRLAALLVEVCEQHRRYRDYTRTDLFLALQELIAAFPVYRTYLRTDDEGPTDRDRTYVTEAAAKAKGTRDDLDPGLFDFLADVLLFRWRGPAEERFVLTFQQVTGAVEAKGVEDTAFYRFHRLAALNEVGGDPARFGTSLDELHARLAERQTRSPLAMSSTSTHDTKRSEDTRARLCVLTEMPERWAEKARSFFAMNEGKKRSGWPDRNLEYLLYQTLVATWPMEKERLLAYAEKAAREAKQHTSWIHQEPAYEAAVAAFVSALYDDEAFLGELESFASSLVWPGRVNALAQTLIKLTAPGVPDLYQGSERWDLSVVDPDNRRPVDFAENQALLEKLPGLTPEEILAGVDEGLPKLWVTHQALKVRASHAPCFGETGAYTPLRASGPAADRVVAFARGGEVITVAPRLGVGVDGAFGETELDLGEGALEDRLTGEKARGKVRVDELFARFPVALLVREGTGAQTQREGDRP